MVRFTISQTVFPGIPATERVTRLFVNSYSTGPLVPSETRRLYQKTSLRFFCESGGRNWLLFIGRNVFLCLDPAFVLVCLFPNRGALHPAERIARNLDEVGETDALLDGADKIRTSPINGVGNHIAERQGSAFLNPFQAKFDRAA